MPRIPIPNEVKVKVGIEQGSVYNFSPDKAVANHYFIVVNVAPKSDSEIYLVSFTSKKDNVMRYIQHHQLDPKTCVEIQDGECPFLPRGKDSCINCNLYKRYEVNKLIELIDASNGSCSYPKINENLLNRIQEGMGASIMVAPDIKTACGCKI